MKRTYLAAAITSLLSTCSYADDLQVQRIAIDGSRGSQLGLLDAANAGVIDQKALATFTSYRPGELLEAIPGLIVSQHSGEGKANQFFLRGFNLDHGTDLRTTIDDMPVNQRSHAHGQGWTDLNFLIPELAARIHYKKGPYSASNGDFAAAGSAAILYANRLSQSLLSTTLGQFGYRRALISSSPDFANGSLLYAIEATNNDGPFTKPDRYHKLNTVLRYSEGYANNGFTLSAMHYRATWNASDQIPERAVTQGWLSRFDHVDGSDGGQAQRSSLSGSWRRSDSDSASKINAYLIHNESDLYSNFTYFMDDPVRGDQFSQPDRRITSGLNSSHTWHQHQADQKWDITLGTQVQQDHIHNRLEHSQQRQTLASTRRDDIVESSVGLYVEASTLWTPSLRTSMGVRSDHYQFQVESDRPENSGNKRDHILSPSVNVIYAPWQSTEFYFNLGQGFHSNDARATTMRIDPRTGDATSSAPGLVAARGIDIGVRTEVNKDLHASLSLYRLDIDSELQFLGDAGTTQASAASRRTGIELSGNYQVNRNLHVNLDAAYAQAHSRSAAPKHIPGAIEGVAQLSATIEKLGPWSGSLRLRYVGPRPLTEDNYIRSQSSTTLNAQLNYKINSKQRLELQAFNLSNRANKAIEYYYTSQLKNETQPHEDKHFHPAEPRSFRVVWVMSY